MKNLYKNFVFDLVVAISALILGVVMLPPFGIGVYALNIMLAATVIVYFLVYLWDKLRKAKGSIFIITSLECLVYLFIIVELVLQQFNVFDAINVCRAIGLVLWVRGTASAIGMYLNAVAQRINKRNLPGFILRISMISFGAYIFAHPLLNDLILNWTMCILFFISAVAFGGLALLFSPIKNKNDNIQSE